MATQAGLIAKFRKARGEGRSPKHATACFPPSQNSQALQNVEFSSICKDSTNPTDGGQSPFHALWGFAPVTASPPPLAKFRTFLPLLVCAGPHFTALEAQSAGSARAKPVCASYAHRPPSKLGGHGGSSAAARASPPPYSPKNRPRAAPHKTAKADVKTPAFCV